MRLLRTEWKKILYEKKILVLSAICLLMLVIFVALSLSVRNDRTHFGIMQAFYNDYQVEPCAIPEKDNINVENSIGYILGMNDWMHPFRYEILRSSLFMTFAFVIIFIVFTATEFAKEYERRTIRYNVFCGYSKMNVFVNKFMVLNVTMYIMYLITTLLMLICFSIISNYKVDVGDFAILSRIVSENMLCILVFNSLAVVMVAVTRKAVLAILIGIIWYFSSFMIYTMIYKDNMYYGHGAYILSMISPGTYLYNNCSLSGSDFKTLIIYAFLFVTVSWLFIVLILKKQEV